MTAFLKLYLPFFLLLYLLVVFVVPSLRVYRQTGINPITFGNTGSAHDYIGALMKLVTALLLVVVLVFSLGGHLYQWLVPVSYMEYDVLKYTGLFLIHAAFIWIVIAQQHMKQSWRIGIDEKNKTELITKGLFGISRNPVFLGMIISTMGIFFILPNALSFFLAATTYILIQIQVRLEEEHLLTQHGKAYTQYRQRVKRLI